MSDIEAKECIASVAVDVAQRLCHKKVRFGEAAHVFTGLCTEINSNLIIEALLKFTRS
jgi:hypothetical protein